MGKTYQRVTELLEKEFEEKGVTKYAFCKQTGVNPTSVERYLCGISEPNQASLERLANYFKTSVAWLRGESGISYEQEVKRYSGPDDIWGSFAIHHTFTASMST